MAMATKGVQPSTSGGDTDDAASATAVNPNSAQPTPTSLNFADDSDSLSTSSDEEENQPQRQLPQPLPGDSIQGWPHLALVMAKTPDFAAFSRFRDLHVKSLLYYQAELTLYRKKIHEFEFNDAAHERWAERADELVESGSAQFDTVKKMREVLKEYDKTLLRYSKICALPGPEPYNMQTLRKWLRNRSGGDSKVRGISRHTWGNTFEDPDKDEGTLLQQFGKVLLGFFWTPPPPEDDLDLAATAPQRKIDGFTRWVVCDLIRFCKEYYKRRKQEAQSDVEKTAPATVGRFRKYWKKKKKETLPAVTPASTQAQDITNWVPKVEKEETLESWGDKTALRVTSAISTVVACLLPVIAISILSQLHGLRNLLICLAGFAIIFALALIFLTQGTSSRTEIFAATAAFSAVMVVFISIPPAPVIDIFVPPGSATPSVSSSPTLVSVGLQSTY